MIDEPALDDPPVDVHSKGREVSPELSSESYYLSDDCSIVLECCAHQSRMEIREMHLPWFRVAD